MKKRKSAPTVVVHNPAGGAVLAPRSVDGLVFSSSVVSAMTLRFGGQSSAVTIGLPSTPGKDLDPSIDAATSGFRCVLPDPIAPHQRMRLEVEMLDGSRHSVTVPRYWRVLKDLASNPALLMASGKKAWGRLTSRVRGDRSGSEKPLVAGDVDRATWYHPPSAADRPVRRILTILPSLMSGGAQLRNIEALERLPAGLKIDVTVLAFADGDLRNQCLASGMTVGVLTDPSFGMHSYRAVGDAVGKVQPDLIMGVTLLEGPLMERLANDPAVTAKLVFDIHESLPAPAFFPQFAPHLPFQPAVDATLAALRTVDRVWVSTEFTGAVHRSSLEPTAPIKGRFAVVSSGVDSLALNAEAAAIDRLRQRQQLGLNPDDFVVVCVGAIAGHKCQVLLARAVRELKTKHPEVKLVLIGDASTAFGAALQHDFADQIERNEIICSGFVEDVASCAVVADLSVCPSNNETQPGVVLEAMARGIPTLATRVGGVPEIITHGSNGWLVEANSVAALRDGIEAVLQLSPADRLQIADKGRDTVQEDFDVATRVDALLDLVGERPPGNARTQLGS